MFEILSQKGRDMDPLTLVIVILLVAFAFGLSSDR